MSPPSTLMVPASGRCRLPIMFSSVLLPQPDGPFSATNSPGSIRSDASRTATTRPNCFETPSTTTSAPPAARSRTAWASASSTDEILVPAGAAELLDQRGLAQVAVDPLGQRSRRRTSGLRLRRLAPGGQQRRLVGVRRHLPAFPLLGGLERRLAPQRLGALGDPLGGQVARVRLL